MDAEPFPIWLFVISWGWVALVIGASIIYRRANGKPIIPRVPKNALFVERKASGTWASNCLIVTVTPEEMVVTPFFPFTLGFLPEVYRMEHRIPLRRIRSVERKRGFLSNNIIVRYDGPDERVVKLRVRDPDKLAAVLAAQRVPVRSA
ncbi:hypothetical protein [Sphingomonas sp. LT1P40]|uniref:hypothetical protein n=1 Tax=Alteristakelama amylovorans TaxID=3096166 RepID=UPI002FC9E128